MSISEQEALTDIQKTLKEQLECAFYNIGVEVGVLVKTIVDTEIANHRNSIENLQKILTLLPGIAAPVNKNTQSSGETTSL
jgi:hypothetical protein